MRTRDPAKEAAIRRKALAMVVKEGFDGLSMQRLAKAAGVSPATIYIYFKNRQDLLLSLYAEEWEKMAAASLRGFDPKMSFAEGLKVQWINRARYFLENGESMHFMEQMRFSPLMDEAHKRAGKEFIEAMKAFVHHAIRNEEIIAVPVEIYWSIAFAPLYQLVKYHMSGRSMPGRPKFHLDEAAVNLTLNLVLKALKPQAPAKSLTKEKP